MRRPRAPRLIVAAALPIALAPVPAGVLSGVSAGVLALLAAPEIAAAQAGGQGESAAPSAGDPDTLEEARLAATPPAVSYVIVDGAGVPEPLVKDGAPDLERGAQVFAADDRGGCVACHRLGDQGGGAGPALDGVGVRLPLAALRLWIVNPAALAEVPGKPAYFSVFDPPPDADAPVTRLTAQEVEDLVAFLAAQR